MKLKRSARTEDAKRGDAFVEAAALGNAARWSLGGDGRRHAWASSADGFGPGRRARTAQGTTAQQGRVGCAHVPGTARHLRGLIGGRRKQCGWLEPSAWTRPDLGRWNAARREMSQAESVGVRASVQDSESNPLHWICLDRTACLSAWAVVLLLLQVNRR